MPGIDDMGVENDTQGICGFTSTLYAVYMNQPQLRQKLGDALGNDETVRSLRMMAEIKTFLQMMKADGNNAVLDEITELTSSFDGYDTWTVDSYIDKINQLGVDNKETDEIIIDDFSIAMPPDSTMEYMRTAWGLKPFLTDDVLPGDVILGLTRTGAPINRWKNLAHYVYQSADGTIYSWGGQFTDLDDVNTKRNRDYSVIYRIMVNA
ncbi:hypothetical protein MGMO_49c00120 [Methyloglobulus morosus KoM1]|uniref:Peptidase C39-like domain-containing protein n=1 Tax=Methyloglobulus morosus KoM1 TaxID=1116472 RepID=V5C2P1_9GAMM|nr:hypothetical protein [Methyloglobulus morosus]ESS72727.1 hypothetical protein MGMO_49c00120 [Methyloglobulus morosus KoM1]